MYVLVYFHDAEQQKKKLPPKKKRGVKNLSLKKQVKKPEPVKKPSAVQRPLNKFQKKLFERNKVIENLYRNQMMGVAKHLGKIASSCNPEEKKSVQAMVTRLNSYSDQLKGWAGTLARNIVYSLNKDDRDTWNDNSVEMSRLLKREMTTAPIEPLLKKYMDEQVDLITSLPRSAAKRIQKLVLKNMYEGGMRAEGLAKIIMQTENVSKSKAQVIARTEVSKISTGLTKARSSEIGLDWYIWRAVHDVRTRDSHKVMDGVVVSWSDPPSPEKLSGQKKSYGKYHAGEFVNCRCYPEPLIRISDVPFPVKVHRKGKIVSMNREQFMKLLEKSFTLDRAA